MKTRFEGFGYVTVTDEAPVGTGHKWTDEQKAWQSKAMKAAHIRKRMRKASFLACLSDLDRKTLTLALQTLKGNADSLLRKLR